MGLERFLPPTAFRALNFSSFSATFSGYSESNRLRNEFTLPGFSMSSLALARRKRGEPLWKEKKMTRTIVTALILSSALILGACNTVEGAGKDVQSAGKAVENAAD